jgi:elongation factor P
MISTNQLKNGNHIEVDGTIFKVMDFQHVNPGKGAAFVRTKLRRSSDGNVIDRTFRAGEKFRSVRTEVRRMQYLYNDGVDAHFMDSESFEQLTIPVTALSEDLQWTKENDEVDG